MGAMVIHVALRFKHAIFVIVRALLFHHSNFKNFTVSRLELVPSLLWGRASYYTTQKFPAVPIHYLRYR